VQTVIAREIKGIFKATEQKAANGTLWWKSNDFSHFVFAQHGSKAGEAYNPVAIQLITERIRQTPAKHVRSVLGDIQRASEGLLKQYLIGAADLGAVNGTGAGLTITRTIRLGEKIPNRALRTDAIPLSFKDVRTIDELHGGHVVPTLTLGSHADGKQINGGDYRLSPFLTHGRYTSAFVNESSFEPQIDVHYDRSGKWVTIKMDVPGATCVSKQEGAHWVFTGSRTNVQAAPPGFATPGEGGGGGGAAAAAAPAAPAKVTPAVPATAPDVASVPGLDHVIMERRSGKFEYRVVLGEVWNLVKHTEEEKDGLYTLVLIDVHVARDREAAARAAAEAAARASDAARANAEAAAAARKKASWWSS